VEAKVSRLDKGLATVNVLVYIPNHDRRVYAEMKVPAHINIYCRMVLLVTYPNVFVQSHKPDEKVFKEVFNCCFCHSHSTACIANILMKLNEVSGNLHKSVL
jgi:hypothetical protein